jgi:hypothetical protein
VKEKAPVALFALAVSFACLLACNADPELVAVRKDLVPFPTDSNDNVAGCVEGSYSGFFQTTDPPDGGSPLRLSGSLKFTLVREGAEEFLHLAPDAKLEGTSEDQVAQFSANVVSQDCKAGAITSTLTDGEFTLRNPTTNESFPPAHFEGTVTGTYAPEVPGFVGTWRTTVNETGSLRLQGTWGAVLKEQ